MVVIIIYNPKVVVSDLYTKDQMVQTYRNTFLLRYTTTESHEETETKPTHESQSLGERIL